MYTVEQQKKRRANKRSPGLAHATRLLWEATVDEMKHRQEEALAHGNAPKVGGAAGSDDGGPGAVDAIDKAAFVSLMVKVTYLIVFPQVTKASQRS